MTDMMSIDLQVANLDCPVKATMIDRRADYTAARIEEDRLKLQARGMPLGKTRIDRDMRESI
jgi:hypothetical protein